MSERILTIDEVRTALGRPRDDEEGYTYEKEHELSLKTADVMSELDQLQVFFDTGHTRERGLDHEELLALWYAAEEFYREHQTYFESQAMPVSADPYYYPRPGEVIITSIREHLRRVWLDTYYLTGTRLATAEDFQWWCEAYADEWGSQAFRYVTRVEGTFGELYQAEDAPESHKLRIALRDLKLIPAGVIVLEPWNIRVSRTTHSDEDNNGIFSLHTPPDRLSSQAFRLPKDIVL
jgi:hypothetical protein